jgi:organic radical activating enzyme
VSDAVQPGYDAGLAIVRASRGSAKKYLSCRFIERALTFFHGRATACCANPATGHTPTIAPFAGELSVAALAEGRASIIERHKRGDIVPECRGCPRLTEADWEAESIAPYAIDEITVAHFSSCNIRCNYCYTVTDAEQTAPLSKAPRILPVFQQLIEQKLLSPNAVVKFSGGEPTLSREFEPLLNLLIDYGAHCIVYTNATKRCDAILDAIRRDKVELVLGIDAATSEVYKAIKKMNYNEKVWKVVAEYCAAVQPDASNKVWAKFIFCLENYHEAAHFARRAADAGAQYVYYDFDSSRIPGRERDDQTYPEVIADYVAVLRHECMKRGIIVEFAQSGMAWLTPEREARIERELERLSRTWSVAESAASSRVPPPRNKMTAAARSDALRMSLMAAQAGLVWLPPDLARTIGRELGRSRGVAAVH